MDSQSYKTKESATQDDTKSASDTILKQTIMDSQNDKTKESGTQDDTKQASSQSDKSKESATQDDTKPASGLVKMYSPYKLAVPRTHEQYTPEKKDATDQKEMTPKKRRVECLRHMLADTSSQVEANVTSALYNLSKGESQDATDHLEKARKVLKMQQQRSDNLLQELSLERAAQSQKIDGLSTRESKLHRDNVKHLEEKHVMQKEIEKLKQELISLKEEQSFETDADDELFFDESVLPKK